MKFHCCFLNSYCTKNEFVVRKKKIMTWTKLKLLIVKVNKADWNWIKLERKLLNIVNYSHSANNCRILFNPVNSWYSLLNLVYLYIFIQNCLKLEMCEVKSENWAILNEKCISAGNTKGEVSLYHWPLVWLVLNQLHENWQYLFLFAKQTDPNQSNRRSMVQWYLPL